MVPKIRDILCKTCKKPILSIACPHPIEYSHRDREFTNIEYRDSEKQNSGGDKPNDHKHNPQRE